MLKGPGFGPTLLPQLITEGMATVFDQAAFPGPANPWSHALTPAQECAQWEKAKPELGETGLYDTWMFGDKKLGIPRWAGFTIGYHIISDYQRRALDRGPGRELALDIFRYLKGDLHG